MKIMTSLTENLIHYAITHGIIYGIKPTPGSVIPSSAVVHAPITVFPYKYPKKAFEDAAILAPIFNELVDKVSRNTEWIRNTLKNTASSDPFTFQLIQILNEVERVGVKQPVALGIIRSDYMLHDVEGDPRNILQVEINTIASSFGSLSTRISELNRKFYPAENVPTNLALKKISQGIAYAHCYYTHTTQAKNPITIMVVQNGERNFADQRLLHFAIEDCYNVPMQRLSLIEIEQECILDETTGVLTYKDQPISVVYFRAGYTPDDYPTPKEWNARLKIEKSNAIKCPNINLHLAGCKKIQQVLAMPGQLERFMSVESSENKNSTGDSTSNSDRSEEAIGRLKHVFAGLYSLDSQEYKTTSKNTVDNGNSNPETVLTFEDVKQKALLSPEKYVMKPQREGGGNNIYGIKVAESLTKMTEEELKAYILMERIFPSSQKADLLRDGIVKEETCVCELGIFGVYLSDSRGILSATDLHHIVKTILPQCHEDPRILQSTNMIPSSTSSSSSSSTTTATAITTSNTDSSNKVEESESESGRKYNDYSGYLLRVKSISSDEGGIASGYSVASSPALY